MKIEYARPILVESIGEGDNKKLFIKGNAIDVGISRNKVMYSEKELMNAAHTLIGKPLLLNHGDNDVRNIIGKVVEADFDGKNVPFKAQLAIPVDAEDRKIISRLEQGLINSVSIGADYKDIGEDDDGIKHPEGIEFLELSLVPVPGVPNATISQVLAEQYKVKKMEEKKLEQLEEELKKMKEENDSLRKKLDEDGEEETPAEQEETPEPEPEAEPEKDETTEKVEALAKKVEKLTEALKKTTEKPKGVAEKPKEEKKNIMEVKVLPMKAKPGMMEIYSNDIIQENDNPDSSRKWKYY